VNLVKMTGVYIFSIYLPLDLNTSISLKLNWLYRVAIDVVIASYLTVLRLRYFQTHYLTAYALTKQIICSLFDILWLYIRLDRLLLFDIFIIQQVLLYIIA
jgi:hypothetical protein